MADKKHIYLSIAKPCGEDWEKMEASQGGRFCANCRKTVIDFTQMTDKELLSYFTLPSSIHCGRFYSSQLNRPVVAETPQKTPPAILKKIAAAVATLLSFKAYAEHTVTTKTEIQTVRSFNNEIKDTLPVHNTSVTGHVTGSDDQPLSNVTISSSTGEYNYTDENGKFSMELKNEKIAPQNFIFSLDGYSPVIRNYHPAMENAVYNIVLYKPGQGSRCNALMGDITGGAPVVYDVDFPSLIFKKKIYCFVRRHKNDA